MKRKIYDKLLEWKRESADKYALLVEGARRVGKSWIVEEFAKNEYKKFLIIDFAKTNRKIKELFEEKLDNLDEFFMLLEARTRTELIRGETLIVFDEVQRFPRAREAIKYLVKDGRFHYIETGSLISIKKNVENIVIPSEVDNEYENYHPSLINLYAYDRRDSIEAKGSNSDFFIYGYKDEEVTDTIGPNIITLGLNDDTFVDGSDINESPLVLATVSDESGVNFSSAGIGHTMTLTIDGTMTYSDVSSYYTPMYAEEGTLGRINYQLSDLKEGPHSLRLRVWDVYNNVSEKTIYFNVVNGLAPEIADVYCAYPASTETSFYVKHNRPDAVVTVTIEVYDLMGRLVWSSTQSGRSDMYYSTPVTWDLTDRGGRRVPRGIYVYRATISTDGVKEATKAKKLAVTR